MSLNQSDATARLQQAQRILDISFEPNTLFPDDLRAIARKILLELASLLSVAQTSSVQTSMPQTPMASRKTSIEEAPPSMPPPPSPLAQDDSPSTLGSVGKTRKNFAKFVRELALPNDTDFFYGSIVFKLVGAGTSSPSLYTMIGKQRIVSHSPSGMINRYEMETNRRPSSAAGWDRLKMLDMEDHPRPLSWEGWDHLVYSSATQTFVERAGLEC
jgi:hypothetical protein